MYQHDPLHSVGLSCQLARQGKIGFWLWLVLLPWLAFRLCKGQKNDVLPKLVIMSSPTECAPIMSEAIMSEARTAPEADSA